MDSREKYGVFSSIIGTITLSDISLVLGIGCSLLTILLLLPKAILNWRYLRRDYATFSKETQKSGFVYFFLYCFGGMRALRKETATPFNNRD